MYPYPFHKLSPHVLDLLQQATAQKLQNNVQPTMFKTPPAPAISTVFAGKVSDDF